jgi:hypothetical protein
MVLDIVALILLIIGVILSAIGWRRSADLKKNRFFPVWKAEGGLNRWLLGGTIFLILGVAVYAIF